jgi:hypothetical protein
MSISPPDEVFSGLSSAYSENGHKRRAERFSKHQREVYKHFRVVTWPTAKGRLQKLKCICFKVVSSSLTGVKQLYRFAKLQFPTSILTRIPVKRRRYWLGGSWETSPQTSKKTEYLYFTEAGIKVLDPFVWETVAEKNVSLTVWKVWQQQAQKVFP